MELQNRRLNLIGTGFPAITKAFGQVASNCILDGGMAVFSNGVPSFALLALRDEQANSIRIDYLSKAMPSSYIVFDILCKDKDNLMILHLLERKSILKQELQEHDYITIIGYRRMIVKPIWTLLLVDTSQATGQGRSSLVVC